MHNHTGEIISNNRLTGLEGLWHGENTTSYSGFRARQTAVFLCLSLAYIQLFMWRADRAEYNTLTGNKLSRLYAVVETRHSFLAVLLNVQGAIMSKSTPAILPENVVKFPSSLKPRSSCIFRQKEDSVEPDPCVRFMEMALDAMNQARDKEWEAREKLWTLKEKYWELQRRMTYGN